MIPAWYVHSEANQEKRRNISRLQDKIRDVQFVMQDMKNDIALALGKHYVSCVRRAIDRVKYGVN